MNLSGLGGIFTTMITRIRQAARRRVADRRRYKAMWRSSLALANAAGMPEEFVVCPHCGAQDWRLPPHGLMEPCPFVASAATSIGLKLDAERNLAISSMQQLSLMGKLIQQHRPELDDEEE